MRVLFLQTKLNLILLPRAAHIPIIQYSMRACPIARRSACRIAIGRICGGLRPHPQLPTIDWANQSRIVESRYRASRSSIVDGDAPLMSYLRAPSEPSPRVLAHYLPALMAAE